MMKLQQIISRVITLVMLIFTLSVGGILLNNELALSKFLFKKDFSEKNVNKIFTTWNYYESMEKVAIGIFNVQLTQDSLNFAQIEFLADSLLKVNPRSSQAYYLKTVVSERNQNLVQASNYLNQALKFDPLNTTYLLGVAVIQINTNQLSEAEETLERVRDLDPNTNNLESLTQLLENLKDKS